MALQYLQGGQAPFLVPPIPIKPQVPTVGWSLPDHSAAVSLDSSTAREFDPLLQTTPIYSELEEGIFGVASHEQGASPNTRKSEESQTSASGKGCQTHVPTDALSGTEEMKAKKTKATIGILSTLIGYVTVNSLYKSVHPEAFIWQDEDREEPAWLASSHSWFDRKACRWLGICGASHLEFVGPRFGRHTEHVVKNHQEFLSPDDIDWDWQSAWESKDSPEDWSDDERVLREIPDYVIKHAPLVHLFSGEQFWPCDIAEHLYHITPTLNYTPLEEKYQHPSLTNLSELNQFERGRHVFLTSKDDPEETPEWLEGEKNIPNVPPGKDDIETHTDGVNYRNRIQGEDYSEQEWFNAGQDSFREQVHLPNGDTLIPSDTNEGEDLIPQPEDPTYPFPADLRRRSTTPQPNKSLRGGRSGAPAVLVLVNKGDGIVDAFWFFFYSFNLGNVVFNVRFGNHVGDWEHTAIRFHHGEPKAVFFSEHSFGSAYSYKAVEKIGIRPVIYSATGTHAMYATPGTHAYVLPWGLLHDQTDRGPLWDPAMNLHAYTYDSLNDTLRSSQLSPKAPTEWFHFTGHWGDKFYPLGDRRQYRFAGQYHYVNGPLGPKFKNLGRRNICPDGPPCVIKNWLGGSNRIRRGRGPGEGEEMSEEDFQRFIGNGTSVPSGM